MDAKDEKRVVNTVDIIIRHRGGIVLIKRKSEPKGWALPGGKLDPLESLEQAAVREAKEETNLDIRIAGQLHTYSDPGRDKRFHAITTVFVADGTGELAAGDDAEDVMILDFDNDRVPKLEFDHNRILMDYQNGRHDDMDQ